MPSSWDDSSPFIFSPRIVDPSASLQSSSSSPSYNSTTSSSSNSAATTSSSLAGSSSDRSSAQSLAANRPWILNRSRRTTAPEEQHWPSSLQQHQNMQQQQQQQQSQSQLYHQQQQQQPQYQQGQVHDLMQELLQVRRDSEKMQQAWSVRCRTLEEEVARLSRTTIQLEQERRELSRQLEVMKLSSIPSSPNYSRQAAFVPFEIDSSNSLETRCVWNGSEWTPVQDSSSITSSSSADLRRPRTPKIDPNRSMSKQDPPPCNSYYLNNSCSVPRCRFSHLYKLTPVQVEEMRRGAKFHLCNALKNGMVCEDPACVYGHQCPRGTSCGRVNCAFNDEQHRSRPMTSPIAVVNSQLPRFPPETLLTRT